MNLPLPSAMSSFHSPLQFDPSGHFCSPLPSLLLLRTQPSQIDPSWNLIAAYSLSREGWSSMGQSQLKPQNLEKEGSFWLPRRRVGAVLFFWVGSLKSLALMQVLTVTSWGVWPQLWQLAPISLFYKQQQQNVKAVAATEKNRTEEKNRTVGQEGDQRSITSNRPLVDQLGLLVQQLLELLHLRQADILGVPGLQEYRGWLLGRCREGALQL